MFSSRPAIGFGLGGTERMPKITLERWAERHYDPPPNPDTLRRWARERKIFPFPQKVGRTYYVEPTAQYKDTRRHGS